jgi:probable rRNA maturation factor
MRMLNRQYRGVDRTTDVLSFPQISASLIHESRVTNHEFVLGDIVINLHKAGRQATESGVTFNEEIKNLLIHGLLHLLGYDHEQGKDAERKMHRRAKKLLENI